MPRKILTLAAVALAGAALVGLGLSQSAARDSASRSAGAPVLIELFTSQGCSSCPPADRLMAGFAGDPDIVAITRPVTYWDRLGWKDTLARKDNTALQRAYAARGGAGSGVYTPQVVVNGGRATVGSRKGEIDRLVRSSIGKKQAVLAVRANGKGGYGIGIAGAPDVPAELVLVALDSAEKVAIRRGENTGRAITYTNVVRDERKVGRWAGGTQSFAVPRAMLAVSKADRYAVVLRYPRGGPVLAARMLPAR